MTSGTKTARAIGKHEANGCKGLKIINTKKCS